MMVIVASISVLGKDFKLVSCQLVRILRLTSDFWLLCLYTVFQKKSIRVAVENENMSNSYNNIADWTSVRYKLNNQNPSTNGVLPPASCLRLVSDLPRATCPERSRRESKGAEPLPPAFYYIRIVRWYNNIL